MIPETNPFQENEEVKDKANCAAFKTNLERNGKLKINKGKEPPCRPNLLNKHENWTNENTTLCAGTIQLYSILRVSA